MVSGAFPLATIRTTDSYNNMFTTSLRGFATDRVRNASPVDVIVFAPFDKLTSVMPRRITALGDYRMFIGAENMPEDIEFHGMLSPELVRSIASGDESFATDTIVFCNEWGYVTGVYLRDMAHLFLQGATQYNVHAPENARLQSYFELLAAFVQAVTPAPSEKFSPSKITIGTDIEFSVFDPSGTFFPATCFIEDSVNDIVGTDGNVETLEVRPPYAKSPEMLVENIEEVLHTLLEKLPQGHDLLGGGGRALRRTTGFHIHFAGTSADSPTGRRPDGYVQWLDALLGSQLLNLPGAQRFDEHYGRPGDWRSKINHPDRKSVV